MDRIVIKDLEIYAYHGVLPEEKRNGQNFIISAYLYLELKNAGVSDDLTKTVNYAQVCEDIREVMLDEKYNLIEAAAENICNTILIRYPGVSSVSVTVSKPNAPIDMVFDTVMVELQRSRHKVYLGIGSNLGDREGYLDYAVDQLNRDDCIRVNRVSAYIETKPYGNVEQDDFLNGCLEIETIYSPDELLGVVNDIELSAGRKRLVHWGPRTLDIDILLYDDEVIMQENLMIPHVEMCKREFVLEPLAEIAPYVYHPVYNKSISELYELLKSEDKGE